MWVRVSATSQQGLAAGGHSSTRARSHSGSGTQPTTQGPCPKTEVSCCGGWHSHTSASPSHIT
jgi:hypothetical protein